jgi:hypothetical protein
MMKPTTLEAARSHHSLPAMRSETGRLQGSFDLDEGASHADCAGSALGRKLYRFGRVL